MVAMQRNEPPKGVERDLNFINLFAHAVGYEIWSVN